MACSAERFVGEVRFSGETLEVAGWCWLPDSPDDRQVVDVLADGQRVATVVADRLDAQLANCHIGDGRHAFSLVLPGRIAGYGEIALSARGTGQVFARAACAPSTAGGGAAAFDPFAARLDWLANAVAALEMKAGDCTAPAGWEAARSKAMATGTVDLGARRPDPSLRLATVGAGKHGPARPIAAAIQLMQVRLAHKGPVTLPVFPDPAVSIVLCAENALSCAQVIHDLAPATGGIRAEIIVVDGGQDALARVLPASAANIRYIFDRDARAYGRACALGADEARGDLLVFLNADPRPRSAAALTDLVAASGAAPCLKLGAAPAGLLARFACSHAKAEQHFMRSYLGFNLCLPRSMLRRLGGFDFTDTALPGLECADLALKADLMGVPRETWREPAAGGQDQQETDDPLAACNPKSLIETLISFQTRWGCESAAA